MEMNKTQQILVYVNEVNLPNMNMSIIQTAHKVYNFQVIRNRSGL